MRTPRKKALTALFVLIVAGCGNTNNVEQDYSTEVSVWKNGQWTTDWMQKYVEYARGRDAFYTDERIMDTWQRWGLAYIDNDTIPEMILYGCEATGCKVLTIFDGKVSEWNSFSSSRVMKSFTSLPQETFGYFGFPSLHQKYPIGGWGL